MLNYKQGSVLTLISQKLGKQQQFTLNQQTLKHMRSFEGDYCFITICGDYRSGKSFLLNSLFFENTAFQTSSTTTACTKGIKIWSQPLKYNNLLVWIIDTEGFGSIQKDASYDGRIFLLSFLLSNVIIYNSFGAIDENSISKLAMICRQAQLLNQSVPRTKFFWALRDFSLQMVDRHGKQLSSDEYLEECLRQGPNCHIKKQKQFLRQIFTERHCVPLIRPLIDESRLNNLGQIKKSELREDFKQQINFLSHRLLQMTQEKTINGIKIGNHNLQIVVEGLLKSINEGNLDLNLNCTYERILEYEQEMRKQLIINILNSKIDSLRKILPVKKQHFNYLRQQITQVINIKFRDLQRQNNKASLQLIILQIKKQIQDEIKKLQKQNKQKIQEQIKDYLYRQLIQLYPKIISLTLYNFENKFIQFMSKLKQQYLSKYNCYQFQEQLLEKNYNYFIQKQEKKVFFQVNKRWRIFYKQFQQKLQDAKKSKKSLEDQNRRLKQQKLKLTKTFEDLKKQQIKNIEKIKEQVEEAFKEQARMIARNYQQKIQQVNFIHQKELNNLKQALQQSQNSKNQLLTEFQYEKQTLSQKINFQKQRTALATAKWEQVKINTEVEQEQRKNSYENKLKIAEIKFTQLQNSLSNERKRYQLISQERKHEQNRLLQQLAQKNYRIQCLTNQLVQMDEKYKRQLQRILIQQKDILCKTLGSKINQYEYRIRVYESKIQQLAINAQQKQFYEQRCQELQIEIRQLKASLEESEDKSTLLMSKLKKAQCQIQEKEQILCNTKEQHSRQLSLLTENLNNNKNYIKQSQLRHNQELEWHRLKLQNALKDQSSNLTQNHEHLLELQKKQLEQKFDKQRFQLKQIIKSNYDEVENLKIELVTLNTEMDKIYEILSRILVQHQNFKPQFRSRANSYLTSIAQSPEQNISKITLNKQQRINQYIAQQVQQIFLNMKQEMNMLIKQRQSIKQDLQNNIDQLDSYEKLINKLKLQNKFYRIENEELNSKIVKCQSTLQDYGVYKQKAEINQKQCSHLRRELALKEQLFSSRQDNARQNSIMYKQTITNLNQQIEKLTLKTRQLTQNNQLYESQLERFKIWASEIKSKSILPNSSDELEMSAGKIKELQNQIKHLAKRLQEERLEKLQKNSKKQINLYTPFLHENRIEQIELLREQNQQLYRKLQDKNEVQRKAFEQRKLLKQRQAEQDEARFTLLKQEFQVYKKRSKQTILSLQSKIDLYAQENKQLKLEFMELQNNFIQKNEISKKIFQEQIEDIKREKQEIIDNYNKRLQSIQENLTSKIFEADKRVAQADLRLEKYRSQLDKQHNKIVLEGERHRLKYEHLLKVNGQLIKQVQSLKSKAHQITLKQKYKSKISSLFND